MSSSSSVSFDQLALPAELLKALSDVGYESPSPIQAECIPLLLNGQDLIGQAQTGTGKTAAFALPSLARLDVSIKKPQVCVICPTRELAIQVAEAFTEYSKYLKSFKVLPIYGGQPYPPQLRQLERGVQVVVGTPGRIMDHMRRGSLKWDNLQTLVLDEADEMLRMGFIDDVEWILEHTPKERQIALFSATMPKPIKKVAEKFLKDPQHIKVKSEARTASTIEQFFLTVSQHNKLEALTRVLESEVMDAAIIFVRTKSACDDLSKKLSARGFSAAAIHGDMQQKAREQMVQQLKDGTIDVIIATDVAARGLDVERISHVINFDIPHDSESYVHRIGRTGRAGRSGRAILFITPRERHLLNMIERHNSIKIERLALPSVEVINDERVRRFFEEVQQQIIAGAHEKYLPLMERIQQEHNQSGVEIAAAMASIIYKDKPLLIDKLPHLPDEEARGGDRNKTRKDRKGRNDRDSRSSGGKAPVSVKPSPLKGDPDVELERYVIHVGRNDGVMPKNIVGAIANEADIDSRYIGDIKLFDDVTSVDLPAGMPPELMQTLGKARVCGRALNIETAKDYVSGKNDSEFANDGYNPNKSKPKSKKAGGRKSNRSSKPAHAGEKSKKSDKPKKRKSNTKSKTS